MSNHPHTRDPQLGIKGSQVVYRNTAPEQETRVVPASKSARASRDHSTSSPMPTKSRTDAREFTSGYPQLVVGVPSNVALSKVTRLPDQGSSVLLWILFSLWLGGSSVMIAPKAVLKPVLQGVKKVLDQQLTYPEGWAGLPPELTSPVTAKLCLEFGPLEFIRAVLAVSSFYILLHHDSNVVSLYPMLQELERAYTQWAGELGVHHEFLPWHLPVSRK
jgi:hypothetical protein